MLRWKYYMLIHFSTSGWFLYDIILTKLKLEFTQENSQSSGEISSIIIHEKL